MGLPLFHAPVESDILFKATPKHRTSSPPRTSIRRGQRDSRQGSHRRADGNSSFRIFNTLYRHEPPRVGGPPPPEPSRRHSVRVVSSIPRGVPQPPVPRQESASSFREELDQPPEPSRAFLRNEARRRARLEAHMTPLFGPAWRDFVPDSPHQDVDRAPPGIDVGFFSIEPQSRSRRSDSQGGTGTMRPRDENRPNPSLLPHARHGARSALRHLRGFTEARTSHDTESLQGLDTRSRARLVERADPLRRLIDGLGDRERSLSPESWDTLLSTLTPDPRPPSASTSFVSTASQGAVALSVSANTSAANLGEPVVDGPCEPGNEDSEAESYRAQRSTFARVASRQPSSSSARAGRLIVRPWAAQNRDTEGSSDARRETITGLSQNDSNGDDDGSSSMRTTQQSTSTSFDDMFSIGPFTGLLDEEPASGPHSRNRETPIPSSWAGEEDLHGMRRILRNMARSSEIPDEWWAEAGLSRTLPREGSS